MLLYGVMTSCTRRSDETTRLIGTRLADVGARFTRARRLVVRALTESPGPMIAADLHETLRGEVPLSSLYRTLSVLEGAGILAREHGSNGVARHELAEWLTGHHHHLVCTDCGVVQDVTPEPAVEREIVGFVDHIATAAGYRATDHRLDIEGTCAACTSK